MATYRFDAFTDTLHILTIDWTGNDLYNRKRWRYQLIVDDVVMSSGDDLMSPMHGSEDEAARAALGFLTLRPGDTDADYFDGYTATQEAWRDEHAEALSMALYHEDGAERADLSDFWTAEPPEDDRDTRCGVGDCAGKQRVVPGTEHIDADGSAMATTRCDAGPHEGAMYWAAPSPDPTCEECLGDGQVEYCTDVCQCGPTACNGCGGTGQTPAAASSTATGDTTPASDAEFLAGCERYARTLRSVAEGMHGWILTLHAMALPTAVLDPLHTTAVAVDAAATDLANAATTFSNEFEDARDVAAHGLTITGE